MVSVLTSALFYTCRLPPHTKTDVFGISDRNIGYFFIWEPSIHVVNQDNFMFEVHILVHRWRNKMLYCLALGGYFTGLWDTSIADFQKAIAF